MQSVDQVGNSSRWLGAGQGERTRMGEDREGVGEDNSVVYVLSAEVASPKTPSYSPLTGRSQKLLDLQASEDRGLRTKAILLGSSPQGRSRFPMDLIRNLFKLLLSQLR